MIKHRTPLCLDLISKWFYRQMNKLKDSDFRHYYRSEGTHVSPLKSQKTPECQIKRIYRIFQSKRLISRYFLNVLSSLFRTPKNSWRFLSSSDCQTGVHDPETEHSVLGHYFDSKSILRPSRLNSDLDLNSRTFRRDVSGVGSVPVFQSSGEKSFEKAAG